VGINTKTFGWRIILAFIFDSNAIYWYIASKSHPNALDAKTNATIAGVLSIIGIVGTIKVLTDFYNESWKKRPKVAQESEILQPIEPEIAQSAQSQKNYWKWISILLVFTVVALGVNGIAKHTPNNRGATTTSSQSSAESNYDLSVIGGWTQVCMDFGAVDTNNFFDVNLKGLLKFQHALKCTGAGISSFLGVASSKAYVKGTVNKYLASIQNTDCYVMGTNWIYILFPLKGQLHPSLKLETAMSTMMGPSAHPLGSGCWVH